MLHPSFPVCVTCTDVFTQVTYHTSLAEKNRQPSWQLNHGEHSPNSVIFFLKNHRISKIRCQRVEDIMFLCRSACVLMKSSRGITDLYNRPTPPLPLEGLCKQKSPLHQGQRTEVASKIKETFLCFLFSPKKPLCHPDMEKD